MHAANISGIFTIRQCQFGYLILFRFGTLSQNIEILHEISEILHDYLETQCHYVLNITLDLEQFDCTRGNYSTLNSIRTLVIIIQ